MKTSFLVFCLMLGCISATPAPPDHAPWDKLLKKYVNQKGMVNYKGMKSEIKTLDSYLEGLSSNPPEKNWSPKETLAYWMNAYNAFTIKLILTHYPVGSIKDIGSKIQIPFVTTPWAAKFFKIGGKDTSLDNIEHGIIRKQFSDPRIHFALVCAATSCPPLRAEAFTADKLDAQLDDQGRRFVNDNALNQPANGKLSNIFKWYRGDFVKKGQTVIAWVNKYAITKLPQDTNLQYLDYNWALNEQ